MSMNLQEALAKIEELQAALNLSESRAVLEHSARCGPSVQEELDNLRDVNNMHCRTIGHMQTQLLELQTERNLVRGELEVHTYSTVEAEIRREKGFLGFPVEKTFAAAIRQLWYKLTQAQKELDALRPERDRLSLLADAQGAELYRIKALVEGGAQ